MRFPEDLFPGAEHLLEAGVVDQAAVFVVALRACEDDLEEELGRGHGLSGCHFGWFLEEEEGGDNLMGKGLVRVVAGW